MCPSRIRCLGLYFILAHHQSAEYRYSLKRLDVARLVSVYFFSFWGDRLFVSLSSFYFHNLHIFLWDISMSRWDSVLSASIPKSVGVSWAMFWQPANPCVSVQTSPACLHGLPNSYVVCWWRGFPTRTHEQFCDPRALQTITPSGCSSTALMPWRSLWIWHCHCELHPDWHKWCLGIWFELKPRLFFSVFKGIL